MAGDVAMLWTNILLGFIIFLLIIIFGGPTNIDRKLLSNAENLRLKMLSEYINKQDRKEANNDRS